MWLKLDKRHSTILYLCPFWQSEATSEAA